MLPFRVRPSRRPQASPSTTARPTPATRSPRWQRSLAVTAVAGAAALLLTGCADAIRSAGQEDGGQATGGPAVEVFEDFACPYCASFHEQYGGVLHGLTAGGQAEADYRIVDFLGGGNPESWSTRAATAYYCFEEESGGSAAAAGRLHGFQSWLFQQAPEQPGDEVLAAQAGRMTGGGTAAESIETCIAEDGADASIESAMSDFTDYGLRGVPSVYAPAEGILYDPDEHGDLVDWLTGEGKRRATV